MIYKQLAIYKKAIEEKGYEVFSIMLRGSQNYHLDDEVSDVDCYGIVFKRIDDYIDCRDVKFKLEFDKGEVVVFDIQSFYKHIQKGNPSFVEAVHSKYIIGDKDLFSGFKNSPKVIYYMALDKVENLSKRHLGKQYVIDIFGYDPKQFTHALRLFDLLDPYKEDVPFKTYDQTHELYEFKRNPISLEQALLVLNKRLDDIKKMVDHWVEPIQPNIKEQLKAYQIQAMRNELFHGESITIEQSRTFGYDHVNKKHLKAFPIINEWLKQTDDGDISYVIVSEIEKL